MTMSNLLVIEELPKRKEPITHYSIGELNGFHHDIPNVFDGMTIEDLQTGALNLLNSQYCEKTKYLSVEQFIYKGLNCSIPDETLREMYKPGHFWGATWFYGLSPKIYAASAISESLGRDEIILNIIYALAYIMFALNDGRIDRNITYEEITSGVMDIFLKNDRSIYRKAFGEGF